MSFYLARKQHISGVEAVAIRAANSINDQYVTIRTIKTIPLLEMSDVKRSALIDDRRLLQATVKVSSVMQNKAKEAVFD